MQKQIIAFTGYARSGKDTAADILEQEEYFVKIRFAQSIYEMLATMLGVSVGEVERLKNEKQNIPQTVVSVRHGLQTLGSEWGRQQIDEKIWAKTLINRIETFELNRIVVPDLRFLNEAETLYDFCDDSDYELTLVSISRPESEPQIHHASEQEIKEIALEYPCVEIVNDQDLVYLENEVKKLVLTSEEE